MKGLGSSLTFFSEKRPSSCFLGLVGILFGTFYQPIFCKLSTLLYVGTFTLRKQPFDRFVCSIGFLFNLYNLSCLFFSASSYLFFFSPSIYRNRCSRSALYLIRSFSSFSSFISASSCIFRFEFILSTSRLNPCTTSVASQSVMLAKESFFVAFLDA